jgi:hypothetical protein
MESGWVHLAQVTSLPEPYIWECGECVGLGDQWVYLRMCMDRSKVGCYDNFKNRHATAHYNADGHASNRSIEGGERWGWCYLDNEAIELNR